MYQNPGKSVRKVSQNGVCCMSFVSISLPRIRRCKLVRQQDRDRQSPRDPALPTCLTVVQANGSCSSFSKWL